MTSAADSPVRNPGPTRDDPGTARNDVALFYSGLVALTGLLAFGSLALMAVLPMFVPGYMSASITSGSMMPTLQVGDVLIAVDHDGTDVAPHTVVVYEDPRKHDLVTHRVVSANPDGSYTTRADASGVNDPKPIPETHIRSKAQWIIPFVGLPRVWVAQQRLTPLVLTVAITALALWPARFVFDSDPWPAATPAGVDAPS